MLLVANFAATDLEQTQSGDEHETTRTSRRRVRPRPPLAQLLGRPEKAHWRPGSTDYAAPRRPIALEDHPHYSATPEVSDRRSAELDRRLDEWEAQQRANKADLDRKEAELRERELEQRERDITGK